MLLVAFCAMEAQQLYVGANYHPHDDKDLVKIQRDIDLMKEAGFNVVRLGHLAWDSYEPEEGVFDFEWFDTVMDMMHEAGIGVILDIATRPAPIWLHAKYPSIDIVDASGDRQYPNRRYMDDVGDPMFQEYALRFTDVMSKRYADHPALLAYGVDNEPGDGPISYSETVRQRFIVWLEKKYGNVDKLNEAWDSQRWSRRIGKFEEVGLPTSDYYGAPERMLDFRRFVSDEVGGFYMKMVDLINENAPGVLLNTNAWYYSPLKYFDYVPLAYSGKMTRHGFGFYPGNSLITNWGVMDNLFGITRVQFESENPFWCSEFTTMTAVPGSIRKSAYSTLFYGNQLVCGWTWQSMHGGEEQYLQGMMDWDGETNRKYDEYKQIATEFRKLAPYFPYKLKAEAGLAYSFDSQMASASFPERHENQIQACFDQFFHRNMDVRMLDLKYSPLNYKLLFIPGLTVMDEESAAKVRRFVEDGGTVVMTANSAVVDNTGKVFGTTRPGLLHDVFGIRVASYEEVEVLNEVSRKNFNGRKVALDYKGNEITCESARFDVIQLRGASELATLTSVHQDYPIITSNRYGKGQAIYIGLPAKGEVLSPLLDDLIEELGMQKGPEVPAGVMARQIDESHILYFNPTGEAKTVNFPARKAKSVLWDRKYEGSLTIPPYEPEFIELK